MFRSWRIGTLLGFPIEVAFSFLLLLGVVLLWMGGLVGLFVVGLAFSSVLLHELGHAVVARRLGVRIAGIELNFFGGAAKMIDLPRSANHEIAIAAAGPAVSLVLAGLGFGLAALVGPGPGMVAGVSAAGLLGLIGWINTIIALFNLIPALPMDGGRILRAALTRRFDYVRATDLAVTVSRVAAAGFVVYGLAFGQLQLVVLAPLLWIMGTREKILARVMAHRFGYDGDGYNEAAAAPEVEVLPRGWQAARGPGWGGPATRAEGGGAGRRRVVVQTPFGPMIVELDGAGTRP
ncbi:MAG: M50 family metallopeptidase [Kofleriaceae bacterium]|nr:M50 family metallopeptidase [Kofleriaceae bacterium]